MFYIQLPVVLIPEDRFEGMKIDGFDNNKVAFFYMLGNDLKKYIYESKDANRLFKEISSRMAHSQMSYDLMNIKPASTPSRSWGFSETKITYTANVKDYLIVVEDIEQTF